MNLRMSALRVAAAVTVFLSLALFIAFRGYFVSTAETNPAALLLAPAITATNNDALVTDVDGDGIADPGDTIEYTVTINNGAAVGSGNDATGMIFTDTIDANMTLVPGSLSASPIAGNDTFSVTGNVRIQVPDGATDLLANDLSPISGTNAGLTASGAATSANGGDVTINANGSFAYNPPPGFEGADTFTYTVTDANGATGTGTVTLNVSGMIWFVQAGAPAGGNGRLTAPFNCLTGAGCFSASANEANDNIFLYTGSYPGGVALKSGQKLIGQGATASLSSISGITPAANSDALPSTNGTRPTVSNAGGVGITLNSNNTIRGLNAGGSTFALDDNGTVGNLTISEMLINSAGGGFRADGGGTLAVTLDSLTAAGGANCINLDGVSGSFSVAGAVTVSNSTSHSIVLTNSAAAFNVGGLTQINTPASGFIALNVSGGAGAITFANVDINGRRDKGIRIAGGSRNITTGALDIDNPNANTAIGLEILSTTGGTISFGATTINNGGAAGSAVEIQSSAASISFGAGSSITNSASHEFFVNAGAANITYNGSIGSTAGQMIGINARTGGTIDFQGNLSSTAAVTPISANGNTGGTVIFSGGTKTLNSVSATAVNLTSNTGATFNFTNGGLDIDTTSGVGFNATGGGTVSVTTGTNANTINSTGNTALNVSSTNIGAGGMTFLSISAAGTTKGIALNTTGASGGLSVTGTAATNGSGGTIQNITQRGVEAVSTVNLSLKNMTFTNANTTDGAPCGATDNSGCNAALHLNTVTGATLDNVDVSGTVQNGINVREVSNLSILNSTITNTGSGGQTEEGGLYALNLFGTSSISNSTFSFPAARGAVIYNTSKTLNLTVSNSQFNDTQTSAVGADGFEISSFGTSNTTLNISNCTFLRDKTNAVQIIGENTSTTNVNITGSTVDPQSGVGVAFDISGNGTATVNFNVNNNPEVKGRAASIINIFAQGNSTLQGRVNNNTVTSLGGSGSGIRAVADADGDVKIEIDGNTVSNIALDNGITAISRNGTGRMDATITDNNVTILSSAGYNIQVAAGASSSTFTNKACANVANNSVSPVPSAGAPIGNYQLRAATNTHELFVQGAGNAANNWNTRGNLPASPPAVVSQSGAGIFTFNQTCLQPSNPFVADASIFDGEKRSESNSDALAFLIDVPQQTPAEMLAALEPAVTPSVKTELNEREVAAAASAEVAPRENAVRAKAESDEPGYLARFGASALEVFDKLAASISPVVSAQGKEENIPVSIAGETVTVGAPSGFTLPASKAVTIKFRATINNVPNLAQVSNQGTVSGSNFGNVLTDDPTVAGSANPTVTLVDRTNVAVSSSQNPSVVGQSVTLTATLTGVPAHAAGDPSGTVEFFNNGSSLGTANVAAGTLNDNTATAVLSLSNLPAGTNPITATYSGGGQYNASTVSNTVNQAVSNTAVWDGSASADWNNAANWATNFAPIAGNNVDIPAAGVTNNPTISATDITVNSLTEAAARTLTVNGGRTLTVTGACTINGTLTVAGAFTCGTFAGTGTVNFTGAAAQNVPALAYQNLTVNNASGVNLSGDTTVNGVLTLTNGNVNAGANTLILGGAALVSRTSGHVIGNIRKTFSAASSFAFPVGTASGFSPATINVTAGAFPLAFNVRAVPGSQPILSSANSLQRYWQISPTGGNPTANLTFNYLQTDVAGTETSYRIIRVSGTQVVSFANNPPDVVIDTTNNVATINGVTAFSDWTLGALAPTAANVAAAGRVVNAEGRGVFNAEVVLTDANGEIRTARTNPFGYFRFTNLPAGATYVLSGRHKQYEFTPQVISITEDLSDIILVASEE